MFRANRLVTTVLLLLIGLASATHAQSEKQPIAANVSSDVSSFQALTEQYFSAYARKDIYGLTSFWSGKATDMPARKRSWQETFAAVASIDVLSLKVTKVENAGDKARVEALLDVTAVDAKTGQLAKSGFGKMTRVFRFVKEDGIWKILNETSAEEELVGSLAELKTEAERSALLAANKELQTTELRRALIAQGGKLTATGKHPQALELYRLAQSIAEQIGDKFGAGDALLAMTQSYYAQSDYKTAIEYLEKSLKWHESYDDKFGVAKSLNGLSVNHRTLGNYDLAIDYGKRALAIFEQVGEKRMIMSAMVNLGSIYYAQDRYDLALEHYRKPLLISEELGDKFWIGLITNNIGLVYSLQGNYALAMEHFLKSLKLKEEVNDKFRMAYTLDNIGSIYSQQGNYALALEYFQRSLKINESLGNKRGIASALHSIGLTHFRQGDYIQALDYHQRALKIIEATGGKSNAANVLSDIGDVWLAQGDRAQALIYYQKSLEIHEEIKNPYGVAGSLIGLSDVARSQGEFAKAKELAERALAIAQKSSTLTNIWSARLAEGRASLGLSQPVQARRAFEEAITTIETVRSQVAGGEEEQERFFANKLSPYHHLIQLLVSQNNRSEALAYAEKAKARVLLDVLQSGRTNVAKAMSPQEREREGQLKQTLSSLNKQIARETQLKQPDQSRLTDFKANLQKARLEFEEFQISLYAAHPELKARRGEAQLISLNETAGLFPDPQTAILEYVVTEDKTYLFVLSRSGKSSGPLVNLNIHTLDIKQKDLAARVNSFRRQLARRDLNFGEGARQLGELLLGAAERELKGKTALVIVPDGVLWELPFQALQPARDHYLIEDLAISYAPSLTVLREMTRTREKDASDSKPTAPTLLAFGNPSVGKQAVERTKVVLMDEKLDPLPEAEKLVNALPQLYGARQSKVYTGAEAREDRAKAEAANFRILQFATHGVLNDASPMYSHVLLSQTAGTNEDGMLEAWEMMNLNLRADLVVLSACETARGRVSAGEGVIGMSWALFVAGSPSTVVSQWKVESSSTTALMLEFHRRLKIKAHPDNRMGRAAALREAGLKLLRDEQYRHPFYWAGFVLVGDGR